MHKNDLAHMYLNNVWRPNLSITGADGLPPISQAGNVVRAFTSARVSLRLPPTADAVVMKEILLEKLTKNVPYNASVTVDRVHAGSGWCMKTLESWLKTAIEQAGADFYDDKPTGSFGEGGSIPFLKELEKKYPQT
jgi:hypothetical protein